MIKNFFAKVFNESEAECSKLFVELSEELPGESEDNIMICSCVAGMLARVAYVDFHIDEREIEKIELILDKFLHFDKKIVKIITHKCIDHIKDNGGLENHLYVHPLNDLLERDLKIEILKSLFLLAASDDEVTNRESEEIKLIAKGLRLRDEEYRACRAGVAEYLAVLNK